MGIQMLGFASSGAWVGRSWVFPMRRTPELEARRKFLLRPAFASRDVYGPELRARLLARARFGQFSSFWPDPPQHGFGLPLPENRRRNGKQSYLGHIH